jgi:hypothetical protein
MRKGGELQQANREQGPLAWLERASEAKRSRSTLDLRAIAGQGREGRGARMRMDGEHWRGVEGGRLSSFSLW